MNLFKLKEGYSDSFLLKMFRWVFLGSFGLGLMLGMSLAFVKIAELKGEVIELYKIILVPGFLFLLFIFMFYFIVFLVIPELEQRLSEKN